MPYFGIQVKTTSEGQFIAMAKALRLPVADDLSWPRRRLRIRKGGQWRDSLAPLFPGYVFLRSEGVDETSWHSLRTLPGFIRFLPASDRILPLDNRDQTTLLHFLSFGEVVEKSVVTFDEAGRIRVVSGPLKGMEGRSSRWTGAREGRAYALKSTRTRS